MILEANLQRFAIKAFTFTDRALHPDICQEIHFQLVLTIAFTRFTTSSLDVETKASGFIPTPFRIRNLYEQLANVIKHFDVGYRI